MIKIIVMSSATPPNLITLSLTRSN